VCAVLRQIITTHARLQDLISYAAFVIVTWQRRKHLGGLGRPFSHGLARPGKRTQDYSEPSAFKGLVAAGRRRGRQVSASEAFRSMCTAKQYRAAATEYKERADRATAPDEKREFQNLERSFSTLADNEQWLSDNHDKTVHARERPSAASVPTMQYLLNRGNCINPHSLLKAAKP
jgi:hypothetical protein